LPIVYVSIDFCCSYTLVSKELLKRANIYMTIFIHKRGSSMSQFVSRQTFRIDSHSDDVLFHDILNRTRSESAAIARDKQCMSVDSRS